MTNRKLAAVVIAAMALQTAAIAQPAPAQMPTDTEATRYCKGFSAINPR